MLVPHNEHLHGTIRTLYWVVAKVFGTDYTIFRVLGVGSVLLSAALFFAYAKRRIGTLAALPVAILLLFYGSAWQHVVDPIGFTVVFSIAAGLAALLALERGDRRGDILACAFVSLSVFTFTVGLGYLVGTAVSVLLRSDRLKRAWIFLVPLLLYTAWYLWARQFPQGRTSISNLDNILPFFGQSLAVDTGALSGVNIPFSRFGDDAITAAPASALGWIVAAAFVAALIWRLARGNVPRSLFASIGVLGTYWLAAAIAEPLFFDSQADAVRYVYPGSMGLLLIGSDMLSGVRIPRAASVAALGVVVFSLAMNLVFLRDGATYVRNYSDNIKADLAMLELADTTERSSSSPVEAIVPRSSGSDVPNYLLFGPDPEEYLASAARYGSPAYTLPQLREQPPVTRNTADLALIDTYGLGIVPAPAPSSSRDCRESDTAGPPGPIPPGGALVEAVGPDPVQIYLERFSDGPGVPLGSPLASGWSKIEIPRDAAPEPWKVVLPGGGSVRICPLG